MNRKHKGLRFDENGNVICEPKAEFGSDVDVDGKLTINSAKDLKTKDGTSFDNQTFYDIGDIEFNKEKTLTKEQGEAIYNNGNPLGIKCTAGGFDWHFVNNGTKAVSGGTQYFPYNVIGPVVFGPMYVGVQFNKNNDNYTVQFFEESMPTSLSIDGNKKISLIADLFGEIYINTVNGTPIIQENISQDIKVQSTLYRHTVEFSENGLGYNNRFTAYSEKNTVIDSVQDLITVFGNTKLQCSGTIESGSKPCIGIDVGTTAATTYFVGIGGENVKLSDWYSTQPEAILTITDSVTAM